MTTVPARRASPALAAALGLVLVTASWGSTFPLLKDVNERVPVPDFLAVRFAVAAVVLHLLAPRAVARMAPEVRRRAVWLGLAYGAAQLVQTVGLQHTSASVSGFVTGMYVVLTPVLSALLLRQRVAPRVRLAVALATLGLAVLSLQGFAVGPGELLTLLGALLYAVHIVGLGAWATARDAWGLAVVQMAVVSAVCTVAAVPGGIAVPDRTGDWVALLYVALVAGAFALVVQTWAQAHLPPTRAAVVMTLEPVWAAGFAVAFAGEVLGWRTLVGGLLVLAAMYLCEVPRRGRPAGPGGADDAGPAARSTISA
ncbi:DMT family transporter [Vallicoccus soli]|uniref:DMT family transporter n=1 Tax=Vallicoccus soli TaxID=2339232 RepID=A0A3A3Z353_9ACTN|nr:DMT family transporter [Vallicoccus soli]RJK94891.1 DMT family transporter [Vallicoccus soli]